MTGHAGNRQTTRNCFSIILRSTQLEIVLPTQLRSDWDHLKADGIHLLVEDPLGLSSQVRLVVLVASGRNDPPQVHVPGATYVDEPCDSREGKIGFPPKQHPAPLARQCRRITTVDRIRTNEDMEIILEVIYIEDADVNEAGPGAQIDVEIHTQHGSLGFIDGVIRPPGIFFLPEGSSYRRGHLLMMRGELSFMNEALARLTYTPDPDWSGSDEILVRADDRGFTGSGGSGTDARGIPIDTVPQNDAPLVLVTAAGSAGAGTTGPPPPVEMWEDTRVMLHNVTIYDADVNPMQLHGQILGVSSGTPYEDYPEDVNGGQFKVTVTVEHGRVFFRRAAGLTFRPVAADAGLDGDSASEGMAPFTQGARFVSMAVDDSHVATNATSMLVSWWTEARFTGRLKDCNRALSAMTYCPDVNWNGVDMVHISAVEWRSDGLDVDRDESPGSWPLIAEASMYIRVFALNDAPVVTPPFPQWHPILQTGDQLSSVATRGRRSFVTEDSELLLPGFAIRDVDLTGESGNNRQLTVTVTCRHGIASITWHGQRAGVGPGDSRHSLEQNSLGVDLTGLIFLDDVTGEWGQRKGGMGAGADEFTFRSSLADANAALQSLAFRPTANFFGSGAWVKVEAFDGEPPGWPSSAATDLGARLPLGNARTTNAAHARGVAIVPVTVLAVNDAPSLQLPFSEDERVTLQLNEGEERILDGARWQGSFAASVQASAHYPLRKGMELWKCQGVFTGECTASCGRARELEWKEALVVDLNEGLGDGSPRHFVVWKGFLFFQVGGWREGSNRFEESRYVAKSKAFLNRSRAYLQGKTKECGESGTCTFPFPIDAIKLKLPVPRGRYIALNQNGK